MSGLMTRRGFLASTALTGALTGAFATLATSRGAAAFSATKGSVEAQQLYLQRCSATDGTYHHQLVADIKAQLQGQATDEQIEAAIAAAVCPVCGCPIAAS
jgi:hypothetical protein